MYPQNTLLSTGFSALFILGGKWYNRIKGTGRGGIMYYYEKDYIMRLIHGIARVLARMLFGRDEENGETAAVLSKTAREADDYLLLMIDAGKINEAENRLFEMIESSAWGERELAAIVLSFYDHANDKPDEFLAAAGFSREEIISGLTDAMKTLGMEIPEYLRL